MSPVLTIEQPPSLSQQELTGAIPVEQLGQQPNPTEKYVADAIVAKIKATSTEKEELAVGVELAGLEAGLAQRTGTILNQVTSTETAEVDKASEADIEREAIESLLNSAGNVIATVLMERKDTLTARMVELLSRSKKARVLGGFTVALATASGAYLAGKGIENGIDFASNSLDQAAGVLSVVGSLMGPMKLLLKKSAGEGTGVIKEGLMKRINSIPAERMQEIEEQRVSQSTEEEGDRVYYQLVARELVAPLATKLKEVAFDGDLTGRRDEDRLAPQEQGRAMAKETTDFIREFFDIDDSNSEAVRKKAFLNAFKGVAPVVLGLSGAAKEFVDPALSEASRQILEARTG